MVKEGYIMLLKFNSKFSQIIILDFLKKINSFINKTSKKDYKDDTDNDDNRLNNPLVDADSIISLSTASVKLDDALGLKSTGKCGICVKSVDTPGFKEMKKNVDDFLSVASGGNSGEYNFSYRSLLDDYGYLWFVLKGKKIEDLVAGITSIADTVHEKGFSKQLLATVFEFTNGYDVQDRGDGLAGESSSGRYLIYNNKTDRFYPFVPLNSGKGNNNNNPSQRKRNIVEEKKIMEEIGKDIPFEKDMGKWYPIWNIPV
jgi:hypothetical protein